MIDEVSDVGYVLSTMKKLIFALPLLLTSCVSPEAQQRNVGIMQGIHDQQQYEQSVRQQQQYNAQQQRIMDLQERQLRQAQQQSGKQEYIVTDQLGRQKTYTVEPKQQGFGGLKRYGQ